MEWTVLKILAAIVGAVGLFGWSHSALSKRLTKLELEMQNYPSNTSLRQIIDDKLAPTHVEQHSLAVQLKELKLTQKEQDTKLDELLRICMKLERNGHN